jgi:hypothetical protein
LPQEINHSFLQTIDSESNILPSDSVEIFELIPFQNKTQIFKPTIGNLSILLVSSNEEEIHEIKDSITISKLENSIEIKPLSQKERKRKYMESLVSFIRNEEDIRRQTSNHKIKSKSNHSFTKQTDINHQTSELIH